MKPLTDDAGVVIGVGDCVRQANVHDPGRGALAANARRTGTVVGLGRTKLAVFGRIGTCEVVKFDSVHASLLTVV